MKARAVFEGSFIQTGDGSPAHEIFQEVGATPCNIVMLGHLLRVLLSRGIARLLGMLSRPMFRVTLMHQAAVKLT